VVGTVLQVAQAIKTDAWSAAPGANAFSAVTGLAVTITPQFETSKMLVMVNVHVSTSDYQVKGLVKRNGVAFAIGDVNSLRPRLTFYHNTYVTPQSEQRYHLQATGGTWLDSPNTTNACAYTVELAAYSTHTVYVNRSYNWQDTSDYDGTPTSTLIVMEIAA
jgi:hypothetical protein